MRRIARVAGLALLPEGEFRRDRLAQHDGATGAQAGDRRGIGCRPVAVIDSGAIAGRQVHGIEEVLDADRQPPQGRVLAPTGRQRRKLPRDEIPVQRLPGADSGFARLDPRPARRGQFARRRLALR